jgi:cytoskeletal protein RodZ
MKFLLFKTEKPKQFEYKPRYYDPEKEALEQRKKRMGLSADQDHKEQLRIQMQYEWNRREKHRKRQRNSTIRLLVFVALVILLTYWIVR